MTVKEISARDRNNFYGNFWIYFLIFISENLTPAMALVCVLYLANEKGLELEQTSESNFLIKAPEKDVTAS